MKSEMKGKEVEIFILEICLFLALREVGGGGGGGYLHGS